MKNITKKTLLSVALLGSVVTASFAGASVNAYSFEEATKDAKLYVEFKKGDFNPYWFQEVEVKSSDVKSYAYEAVSKDTPLYREYKEGDFNPYGFQN